MTALPEYQVAGGGEQALLFLHGLGGDYTNWGPQLDAFSATHTCIAWTLPGYGDSPPIPDMSWSALADLAVAVLDAEGAESATIVGLSMGGYVAQQMAIDHPDRVDGLVLAATSIKFGRPNSNFTEKYLASRLAPLDQGLTPADLAPTVVEGLLGPQADPAAAAVCQTSMSRISSAAYRQALACLVTFDITERVDEIATPTLCIAGADDQVAPVASLQRLTDAIAGARLEVIEGCGHLINLDRPTEFNKVVRTFVTA